MIETSPVQMYEGTFLSWPYRDFTPAVSGRCDERVFLHLERPLRSNVFINATTPQTTVGLDGGCGRKRHHATAFAKDVTITRWGRICEEGAVVSVGNHVYKTIDLKDVLDTNYRDDAEGEESDRRDGPPARNRRKTTPNKVTTPVAAPPLKCVLQIDKRFASRPLKRLPGLNKKNHHDDVPDPVLKSIATLPKDVYEDIMKHLDYDQVSWFADKNEAFLRKLAVCRYGLDAGKVDRDTLLESVRRESCAEMRLSSNEDLWMVTVDPENDQKPNKKQTGVGRRFRVRPGQYRWHVASVATNFRVDPSRSRTPTCARKVFAVEEKMSRHQVDTICGRATLKSFVMKGTEYTPIARKYNHPLFTERIRAGSPRDLHLHVWLNRENNLWKKDLVTPAGDAYDARELSVCKTLMFKDPVKFFGVVKVVREVDEGLYCLADVRNGEVLGYLVDHTIYRYRVPENTEQFTGLNFIPTSLHEEADAVSELVEHFNHVTVLHRRQEVADLIGKLKADLQNARHPQLEERLLVLEEEQWALMQLSLFGYPTHRQDYTEELNEGIRHCHDILREKFELCSRIIPHRLGESGTVGMARWYVDTLITECRYEEGRPDTWCCIAMMLPARLQAIFSVRFKEPLMVE